MSLKTYQWSFLQSKVPLNNNYWKNCQSVPPVFSQNRQTYIDRTHEHVVQSPALGLAIHISVYASLTRLTAFKTGSVQVNANSSSRHQSPVSFAVGCRGGHGYYSPSLCHVCVEADGTPWCMHWLSNFLSMKWQWTYGPTLSPWNNHFHTSEACFKPL